MRPTFDHAAIRSRDLEATLRLYVGALGFQEVQRWKHPPQVELAVMLMDQSGVRIEVFDPAALVVGAAADGRAPVGGAEAPPVGVLHLALRVHGLEDAVARAVASGADCLLPPTNLALEAVSGEGPSSQRMSFVRGLDGEVLELIEAADR